MLQIWAKIQLKLKLQISCPINGPMTSKIDE